METYDVKEVLDKGEGGEIVKAVHRTSGHTVVIKLMKNCLTDPYQARKILRQVSALRKMSQLETNFFMTRLLDVIVPGVSNYDLTRTAKHYKNANEK